MKLSISNIAWSSEDDISVYQIMKQNNFTGLEIAPTRFFQIDPYSDENISKAKDIFSKLDFKISSMQSILYGRGESLFGSDTDRDILLSYLKNAINYASDIRCNNLVFGSPKNRIINDYKSEYNLAVNFFAEASEYAKQRGTILSIEANPTIYNTNFINFTSEAYKLVKDVNNSAFKINFDFGTLIYNEEQIDDIKTYLYEINHIHISEPNLELISRRKEHQLLKNILDEYGYNKFISIEMKNLSSIENIKNSIEYISEVFHAN